MVGLADDDERPESRMGWWTISGEGLLYLLRRVQSGEDADMVYAEAYANSDHEHCEGHE
jgi:hypothetical protein